MLLDSLTHISEESKNVLVSERMNGVAFRVDPEAGFSVVGNHVQVSERMGDP